MGETGFSTPKVLRDGGGFVVFAGRPLARFLWADSAII